jgi:hypothetical protein
MRPIQTTVRKAILVILVLAPSPGCDDDFSGDMTRVAQSWTVGATPRIVVDAFAGGIIVKRGTDGVVRATVARNSNCKNESQAIARGSLKFIDVEMGQQEDAIRMKASGGAMGFELYSPDQTGTAEPQPLRLEGWGGDVEITLGPTGYEFRGPIAAVERFR